MAKRGAGRPRKRVKAIDQVRVRLTRAQRDALWSVAAEKRWPVSRLVLEALKAYGIDV